MYLAEQIRATSDKVVQYCWMNLGPKEVFAASGSTRFTEAEEVDGQPSATGLWNNGLFQT